MSMDTNKKTNTGLRTGLILLLVGAALFLLASALLGFDYKKLDVHEYVTHTLTPEGDFTSIRINDSTADIAFVITDGGPCRIECFDVANEKHTAEIKHGELVVTRPHKRNWYDFLDLRLRQVTITLYLPGQAYENLTIDNSTGDIKLSGRVGFEQADIGLSTGSVLIDGMRFSSLRLKNSTGDVTFKNVSADRTEVSLTTGDVTFENVAGGDMRIGTTTGHITMSGVTGKSLTACATTGKVKLKDVLCDVRMDVETDTGDISLLSCDAPSIRLTADTGDIEGSILSPKIFSASSDTGSVHVPRSKEGGECVIETNTGDIDITAP